MEIFLLLKEIEFSQIECREVIIIGLKGIKLLDVFEQGLNPEMVLLNYEKWIVFDMFTAFYF